MKRGKKGQIWGTLVPWIIAVAFLVLVFILYLILTGKLQGGITYFKNLARFGR